MNLCEIDRLVAEKVMGWEVPYEYDDIGIMAYTNEKGTFAFSPSTKIADAWQVVEKLQNNDWCIELYNEDKTWCVDLTKYNSFISVDRFHRTSAKDASLAICLVALKAYGIDVSLEISTYPEASNTYVGIKKFC